MGFIRKKGGKMLTLTSTIEFLGLAWSLICFVLLIVLVATSQNTKENQDKDHNF